MDQFDTLFGLAAYQQDAEASLRLYFTAANPRFEKIFFECMQSEVNGKLDARINETDMRSTLVLLAYVEAAFRLDYQWRRKAKQSDAVSIAFRAHRKKKNLRLDEDIWETWIVSHPGIRSLISDLRGAFKFRHWLAHGRYLSMGQKYDFQTLYIVAQEVFAYFPLRS